MQSNYARGTLTSAKNYDKIENGKPRLLFLSKEKKG
jgi:hypothetical protein